jgi:formylglycine-generating enzyme required for sulfatase activity
MNVFLSYASQDRTLASSINQALLHQGHDVFFDRDDLPPGEEFHNRIRAAIEQSDLFIFLVSEYAVDAKSYTLTELEIAQQVITRPHGRLLPVLLQPIPFERLPEYLKSVTVLETSGDITAAVAAAVDRMAQRRRRRLLTWAGMSIGAIALSAAAVWFALSTGELAQERIGKDGAPAALVPAGTFVMGDGDESPQREIFLDAFYIDRYEVTTARYAKFLAATGSLRPPEGWDTLDPAAAADLPVVGVDWNDAKAYCAWAGQRLPTEAEWEKAARGADQRRYPWGDESPSLDRANYVNSAPEAYNGGLQKVGSHSAGRSPFGIHDMAGNAAEWVADWYSERVDSSQTRNPQGPESGKTRIIRGGGRFDRGERIMATKRYYGAPELRAEDIGFRCAADAR